MKILTYNTQVGVAGWDLIQSLLKISADVVCFQRFPQSWVKKIAEAHAYQPAYGGCENGCLTLHRQGHPRNQGNTSSYDYGKNNSQSTAYIETTFNNFIVVNTLGPYVSPAEGVPEEHFANHVTALLARKDRALIVGDMHFDEEPFSRMGILLNGFKNYSKSKNFNDHGGRGLNLTKLLANFPVHVAKETVLGADEAPQRHFPVLFELS